MNTEIPREQIYRGPPISQPSEGADQSTSDDSDAPGAIVIHANSPAWTRRRALITGIFVGAFFGAVFFAGYAGTSAWICSARLDCGHWAPIAIVSGIGTAASAVFGGIGGFFLHKMYRLFKVV